MGTNWSLFVPIYNLKIMPELNRELKIDDVLFVSSEKIPYIRKRLGLNKRVSDYQSMFSRYSDYLELFAKAETYAFIKTNREEDDNLDREFKRIKDAVYILISSQFYRLKRTQIVPFGSPSNSANILDEYVIFENNSNKVKFNNHRLSNLIPYKLDQRWKGYMENHFFWDLLRILNNDKRLNLDINWWKDIRRAAILAGRSYLCDNIWEALLFDIIAMETLLLRGDDRKSGALTERMFSIFGWKTGENKTHWKRLISRLYDLRSEFVHTGSNQNVEIQDLINADQLLYNLLANICSLTGYFKSKSDIIVMTNKLNARRMLGQNMVERPPEVHYSTMHYSERDIEKLAAKKLWE